VADRFVIAVPQELGTTMSPPFVMGFCFTNSGIVAAGTGAGHLFLGAGGRKPDGSDKASKKKRSRKWNGLSHESQALFKIADGPVVAL
jgi:hypothetical protein